MNNFMANHKKDGIAVEPKNQRRATNILRTNILLEFENLVSVTSLKKAVLMRFFRRGLQILQREKKLKKIPAGSSVHLVLVDDRLIKKLNREYRGKAKATDVLSFSYIEESSFPEKNLIGEIAISIPTAKKQAREHHKTLAQEVQFLFVHGLLHIFGYDHEETNDRREMFDLQDEILQTKSWRKIID